MIAKHVLEENAGNRVREARIRTQGATDTAENSLLTNQIDNGIGWKIVKDVFQ